MNVITVITLDEKTGSFTSVRKRQGVDGIGWNEIPGSRFDGIAVDVPSDLPPGTYEVHIARNIPKSINE